MSQETLLPNWLRLVLTVISVAALLGLFLYLMHGYYSQFQQELERMSGLIEDQKATIESMQKTVIALQGNVQEMQATVAAAREKVYIHDKQVETIWKQADTLPVHELEPRLRANIERFRSEQDHPPE